jgi:hypothetical protein
MIQSVSYVVSKALQCLLSGEDDLHCLGQWRTQEFISGGSTNSFEDRGQRDWGSGGGSHLVRGSAQFANG